MDLERNMDSDRRRFFLTLLLCAFSLCVWAENAHAMTLHAIVRDDAGKPVKNAVVYATGPAGNAAPAPPSGEAVMEQVNKEFIPYVLPIQAGTAVRFPNRDTVRHHVYSISPAKKFELPLYSGTPSAPVVFDKPGVVVLGCNIHDWMIAYIYVMETPYFARTGDDGTADLRGLPQQDYTVRVWHPRMKGSPDSLEKRIAASPAAEVNVDFVVTFQIAEKPEWKPLRVPPREGGRYP